MALKRTGLLLDDPLIFREGRREVALRVQCPCEIEARRGGARVERQGFPAMRDRPVEAAERLIDAGDVIMKVGVGVIQRNRAADQFERRFGAPGLVSDQPKQVQTIRAVGIVGEEPAIEPFRLGEPSCLVLSCRFRQ